MDAILSFISAIRRAYEHITFSKRATFWFVVIAAHCIIQVSLQALTYTDNAAAKSLVGVCLQEASLPDGINLIIDDTLQKCDGVPSQDSTTCRIVSYGKGGLKHHYARRDQDKMFSFALPHGEQIEMSSQCIDSLDWLEEIFRDAKAEDVVTLCFQFWLFAISLLAILNNSIPHLVVSVASHLLDTVWAGFRIRGTTNLRAAYNAFVVEGACNGTDILGGWWDVRMSHAIPIVACNSVALAIVLYLAYMLFGSFVKQKFSRVGGTPAINRALKLVLCFEATLELTAFFALASVAMWIDRVSHGSIFHLARHIKLYQAGFIAIAVILPILTISGFVSIRREIGVLYLLFALLHCIAVGVWLASFASALYRYEITTWAFFACMSITAFVLILLTAITSFICRLNFGKGLAHFLRVQKALGSADFTPGYFVHDPTIVSAQPWSEISFDDPEKIREDEILEPHFPPPTRSQEIGNPPLKRAPSHNMKNTLKRFTGAARTVLQPTQSNYTTYVPRRFSILNAREIGQPKFKLPIEAPPSAFLSSRKLTPSMRTSSSTGSTGVVSYASRSNLESATARTMNLQVPNKF